MVFPTDIRSELRLLALLPVLLVIGGWYLARGDRLGTAIRTYAGARRIRRHAAGAMIIELGRERVRRNRGLR
nr:hypothetical protein HUO10_005374 [Paraburkholderia busanensis]